MATTITRRIGFVLMLSLLCLSFHSSAQKYQRFNAGAVISSNFSQIDGDDQQGYTKFGISGGIRGTARISERVALSMELLFSQRGAKPKKSSSSEDTPRPVNISLNYAEVPILFNLMVNENWNGVYNIQIYSGLSYARLISHEVEEFGFDRPVGVTADKSERLTYKEIAENFNENDWSWVVGFTYFPSSHLGFGLRHNYSFSRLFDNEDFPGKINSSLRTYNVAFQVIYML